ncbi:hypothetical protein CRYUN_Cryun24cG0112600 [Craigia yunnanensis]
MEPSSLRKPTFSVPLLSLDPYSLALSWDLHVTSLATYRLRYCLSPHCTGSFSHGFSLSPTSFILIRFLVGFCLANFVANQFWMSSMFSSSVVGLANGVAAGWANMGAGVAQLVMPLLYSLLKSFSVPENTAWRVIFVVPAAFQALTAILALVYGQDLPCGKYRDSKKISMVC